MNRVSDTDAGETAYNVCVNNKNKYFAPFIIQDECGKHTTIVF